MLELGLVLIEVLSHPRKKQIASKILWYVSRYLLILIPTQNFFFLLFLPLMPKLFFMRSLSYNLKAFEGASFCSPRYVPLLLYLIFLITVLTFIQRKNKALKQPKNITFFHLGYIFMNKIFFHVIIQNYNKCKLFFM